MVPTVSPCRDPTSSIRHRTDLGDSMAPVKRHPLAAGSGRARWPRFCKRKQAGRLYLATLEQRSRRARYGVAERPNPGFGRTVVGHCPACLVSMLLDGGCGYEEYRFPTLLAHLRFSSAAQ